MADLHIHQILNFYTRPEELDPGFKLLDNSDNQRPDWYEYWPIRNFLLNTPLDESAFYGFLSPKFKIKTNLTAADVAAFMAKAPQATDVALFSPSIHKSAYYWNVFVHGDAEHPGLLAVAQKFFTRIGSRADLTEVVTDSRNTVHSNYFIARPRFWRAWLELTEKMYALAEDGSDALGRELNAATQYRGKQEVHMKIFLMERIATYLLITEPGFKAYVHDPFAARNRIYKLPVGMICDALKIAYSTERRGQYKDIFMMVRALSGFWTWQVKMGGALGIRPVARCLSLLKGYWQRKPE
jgi:hypothetical protein